VKDPRGSKGFPKAPKNPKPKEKKGQKERFEGTKKEVKPSKGFPPQTLKEKDVLKRIQIA